MAGKVAWVMAWIILTTRRRRRRLGVADVGFDGSQQSG
ncbi:hypothetical protein I551_8267 [Mycobacterium ulcerans str. Harvey]|uniref:Uncharacterized protein n=1 Tax=Mycobacterium ulcerans str. Harvey TaxID=1299332 RepID=A0ABN0QKW2_MYCUL|nr:hypothetical protein I551_8267 [Mycobacterium ulcerans str. Harvey]